MVFTKLLLNARGVSKETLDSNQASLKSIFKASGDAKAVAGAGFGVVRGGSRTRRGVAAYSPSSPNYGLMSTASSPGPPLFGMGVHPPAGMYATASAWGGSAAQQPSNVRARRATAAGLPARVGLGAGPQLGAAGEAAVVSYPLPLRALRPAERLPSGPTMTPGCRHNRQPERLIPRGTDATTV